MSEDGERKPIPYMGVDLGYGDYTVTGRSRFKDWSQLPKKTEVPFNEHLQDWASIDFGELEERINVFTRGYSKQRIQEDYIRGYYPDLVILDEYSVLKPSSPTEELKDWEHKIPDPNPFNRPVSSPSQRTRAKLRAKRKKR